MNRLFLLLFGTVTLVAHAQVPDYVPTDGLVAWYPFNGNANDETGVSDNGVLFSVETAPDRFGNDNSAFYFSGSGCIPHIETNINWLDGTEGMSISFWINRVGNGCISPRIFGFWGGGNGPQSWGMAWGNSAALDYMGTSPANNTWHHVAVTLTSDSIHAYLNGALQNSYVSSKEPPLASYMSIGRMTHPAYDAFNGYLDDFALYNRTLTQAEITALYNAQLPTPGCTDPTACNFDAEATSDDGSCIPSGCMEPSACNYYALAECEGEACDYTCCPGPGCCSAGMYWDYDLEQCMNYETCTDDLDGDGVIGVNDLMQLLSSFGTDCAPTEEPETAEWTCGDPVNYHGYDYATVQIGEQCWFAENLRTELYRTGAPIPTLSSPEVWNTTTIGARTRFGEWGTECDHDVEAFNACNPELALIEFGYLYNWLAVDDVRALCPTDWHVPTESEWNELFDAVGGPGTASDALKSPEGWAFDGSGTQDIGFNAKPGAQRQITPLPWASAGAYGFWWSSSAPTASDAWGFKLSCFQDNVLLSVESQNIGRSIRCLKVQ